MTYLKAQDERQFAGEHLPPLDVETVRLVKVLYRGVIAKRLKDETNEHDYLCVFEFILIRIWDPICVFYKSS